MYICNNICIEKRFVNPSNELIYLPHIPSHSTVLIYLQWNLHSEWLRLFLFMRLGLVMSQPSFFTANTNKMKQTHWIPAGLFVIFYWATMVLNSVRVAGRVFMTDSDWAAIICHYCIVFTLCSHRVYVYIQWTTLPIRFLSQPVSAVWQYCIFSVFAAWHGCILYHRLRIFRWQLKWRNCPARVSSFRPSTAKPSTVSDTGFSFQ